MTCRYSQDSSLYLSEYQISLGQCGIEIILNLQRILQVLQLQTTLQGQNQYITQNSNTIICIIHMQTQLLWSIICLLFAYLKRNQWYCIFNIYRLMSKESQQIQEIRGSQFPFGLFSTNPQEAKKIFVKKRYPFRSEEELQQIMTKVQRLKSISHKNTINLRSISQSDNSIDLIYQYVPCSLDDSFTQNSNQTVKEMHRQFIELAIYLAKNCIFTTFNPSRCGVVINQQKSILKYYLPLNQITITDNRNMLERSVQLFNVQSMHYLDALINQCLNTTIHQNSSQRTFKNRVKLFPNKAQKERRDSQPTALYQTNRKFSNNPTKDSQMRKLSTLSKQLSQISKMHKRRGASTRVSGDSFKTFRSIISLKSVPQTHACQNNKNSLNSNQQNLKRCLSQNGITRGPQIDNLIARSRRALDSLSSLKEKMTSYKGFFQTLMKLKQSY